ncbi:hypothetical protein [Streptococcus equinus]|uniref:Nmad3 family putative nucleotide modification protein n=1 Tax=Streptococcus equinus TaxID=1335 RepID=UPI0015F6C7AF|nr:hypothetical protein [Streptococcus equinus]MEE0949997.1 hypothetical protein [Streptococcus equinus]QMS96544.1 hypothetical protein H1R75_01245 [Streptococcus equinus]
MKIILSRKGFDSKAGGIPSPILPDGTLLSLPIPSKYDELQYKDVYFDGVSLADILCQLKPKDKKIINWNCHLDPDIRLNSRKIKPENWTAGFGQISQAQGYLRNQEVGVGDLFLFFGWFRQTEGNFKDGTLRYVRNAPNQHILYGYLQIGKMVSDSERLQKEYYWHPHSLEKRAKENNNMLYLPIDTLTFNKNREGFGTFDFAEKYVLTSPGKSKATWKEIAALLPENVCKNVKNSAKDGGIYYAGQWQELVLKENELSEEWAKGLF